MKRSTLIIVIVILAILLIGLILVAVMPNMNIGTQKPANSEMTEPAQNGETIDDSEETVPGGNAAEQEQTEEVTEPEQPTYQLPFVPYEDPTEAPTSASGEDAEDPASAEPTEEPTEEATKETEPLPEPVPTDPDDPGHPNMTPLL